MRRERFWSFPLRLGRIEPDLSYLSASPQPCHHSVGEHNASSIPVRKKEEGGRVVCLAKGRRTSESSDESPTLNLQVQYK
jgi:hypothetical protein